LGKKAKHVKLRCKSSDSFEINVSSQAGKAVVGINIDDKIRRQRVDKSASGMSHRFATIKISSHF
jgi:hypothetical protein